MAYDDLVRPAYHCSSLIVVTPEGHHCQGDKSLSLDACPIEAETDVLMVLHQTTDCIIVAW